MFRHRIKDLMLVNAVLAIALGVAISMGRYLFQVGLIMGIFLITIVLPVVWVETYLYRKKHGTWYLLKNPRKPRPRYQPMTDRSANYPPLSADEEPASEGKSRTQLFEKASPSTPFSRASLLLNVASRFETFGEPGRRGEDLPPDPRPFREYARGARRSPTPSYTWQDARLG